MLPFHASSQQTYHGLKRWLGNFNGLDGFIKSMTLLLHVAFSTTHSASTQQLRFK
jgi:hypothetical protein